MKRWSWLLLTAGCASWSGADTKAATDSVRMEMNVEAICAVEGGACTASQVRAYERLAYCANASMLFRHGQDVPDAGIACQP